MGNGIVGKGEKSKIIHFSIRFQRKWFWNISCFVLYIVSKVICYPNNLRQEIGLEKNENHLTKQPKLTTDTLALSLNHIHS